MSEIISWPESQICIGCVHGSLIMSDDPSQYVCEVDGFGGSECVWRKEHVAKLVTLYEWHCPQCKEWNEIGYELPKEDYVQCNECDSEFKYE